MAFWWVTWLRFFFSRSWATLEVFREKNWPEKCETRLPQKDLTPDIIVCNSVLRACAFANAEHLERLLRISVASWNNFFKSFSRPTTDWTKSQTAWSMVWKQPQHLQKLGIFACCFTTHLKGMIQGHAQEPDVVTYNTLINGYSKQLAWEDSLATLIKGKNSGTL